MESDEKETIWKFDPQKQNKGIDYPGKDCPLVSISTLRDMLGGASKDWRMRWVWAGQGRTGQNTHLC